MSNDSARETGYLGTGRNFVGDAAGEGAVTFTARMRRGSELSPGWSGSISSSATSKGMS